MAIESRMNRLEARVAELESAYAASRPRMSPKAPWPFVLAIVLFLFLLVLVAGSAFNWPHADDFLIIDWFRKFAVTHEYSFYDLISYSNGTHPLGLQAFLSVSIWLATGPNFVVFPILNVLLVGLASTLLVLSVNAKDSVVRWIFPIAAVASLIHPIQANHLVSSIESGWFLVTLCIALNLWLIERYSSVVWPCLLLVCSMASLSSAVGTFAWLLAAVHLVARARCRSNLVASAGFLILFAFITLRSAQGGSGWQVIVTRGWPDFILYLIQLFGSVFGSRDPAVCARLGVLMIFLPLLSFARSWHLTRTLTPMARVGGVYFLAAMTMTAGFGLAHFEYGLPWALDRFNAGPLLVQMGVAALSLGCDLFAHTVRLNKRFALVAVATVLFPLASVVTAAPYSTLRFEEQRTARAVAMHVACFEKPAERRLLATSGFDVQHRVLVVNNIDLLLPMCARKLPARARKLLVLPEGLVRAAAGDASKLEALEALWQIYQTHYDLQRAFDIDKADLAHKLVLFAKNNAATGSQYEPEALRRYAEMFVAIGDF
jgi:hypothetical protein